MARYSTAFGLPVVNHRNAREDDITATIRYFAFCGYTRYLDQFLIKGPKVLWFKIQLWNLSLDLAKQNVAPRIGVLHGSPDWWDNNTQVGNAHQDDTQHKPKWFHEFFHSVLFLTRCEEIKFKLIHLKTSFNASTNSTIMISVWNGVGAIRKRSVPTSTVGELIG